MGVLEVYREGDEYVAVDRSALIHAFGDTEEEALANLEADRDDHFAELMAYDQAGKLSPVLRRVLEDAWVLGEP